MAESFDTVIIGGGISGLGMAIALQQAGITDFVVLERADEVGGTWQANTYPGCACDVPSNLYSYSFAPNPDWSRTYSRQPEIWDYVRGVADRFGVRRYIRLGVEVTDAAWDEDAGRWRLATSDGEIEARILVSAVGLLTEPKVPDLPGLDTFKGAVFHSARWDHDFDLAGKRVAAIGTGASAIQFVPEIQPQVQRLHVFQRTPPWVMPHTARPTSERERSLFRALPALQRLVRGLVYAAREALVVGFVKRPRLMRFPERQARRHIASQISDPELQAKVTPTYSLGCKRILPSNDWYPAIAQPNVELITDAISEIRAHSIVTADGIEREVDAIILGTGFHVTDPPLGGLIHGRGRPIAQRRVAGQHARPSRLHGRWLPEHVPAAGPQHGSRALVDGLRRRVPDRLHHERAGHDDAPRRRRRRGHRAGPGRLQRGDRPADEPDDLVDRVPELVHRRKRAQLCPVAGLDVAIPPPHGTFRSRQLPGMSLNCSSGWITISPVWSHAEQTRIGAGRLRPLYVAHVLSVPVSDRADCFL